VRLTLEDVGWAISGRGDVRPGFFIDPPDSDDSGEVAPLRQLEAHVHGYGGKVGGLIDTTEGSNRGVIVRLSGFTPQPGD
jgi:hypothetical protein